MAKMTKTKIVRENKGLYHVLYASETESKQFKTKEDAKKYVRWLLKH